MLILNKEQNFVTAFEIENVIHQLQILDPIVHCDA